MHQLVETTWFCQLATRDPLTMRIMRKFGIPQSLAAPQPSIFTSHRITGFPSTVKLALQPTGQPIITKHQMTSLSRFQAAMCWLIILKEQCCSKQILTCLEQLLHSTVQSTLLGRPRSFLRATIMLPQTLP